MSEPNIEKLKEEGWGNCGKCGWFFRKSTVDSCPMCHQRSGEPVTYEQPAYENPSLG